jgi:hypothetical protein
VRHEQQVTGVDADGPQLGSGHLDGQPDGLGDVVRVDQQRRAPAERVHLGLEGVPLAVVEEREGMGAGADGRNAVTEAGCQVGGGREATDVRRPGRRHSGQFVGAAGAHLDQRALPGGRGHPGGGGRDRRVVVEDGEDHRLQEHALREGALDPQDRRPGEVHLALGVAPDGATEAVGGQPFQGRLVHHTALAQKAEDVRVEAEVLDRVQHPSGPGHDAVAAALGQPAREDLEDRAPVGGPALEGGLQHRQLVVVREERGGGNINRQP